MAKLKKKTRRWIIVSVAVLAVVGFFGYRYYKAWKGRLPPGIASGNGRIESQEVDISPKQSLRVKKILVNEGDLVKPGQVVVEMDTSTLDAELEAAKQNAAAAKEQLAVAKAAISRSNSQIELAKIEKERAGKLVEQRAGSQRELDVRTMAVKTTSAGLAEEKAKLEVAQGQLKVAEAQQATIQSEIDDATLRSPVTGRVLYRVAQPGEVLAAGGKALTLIDLDDVYMEIFLPSNQAAALKIGDQARFTVDFLPGRAAPGVVSFVSPEAQFTPKAVETRSEREKLMFRVKIQVPKDLVSNYTERIKTGVRGVGYVRTRPDARFPDWIEDKLITAPAPQQQPPGQQPAPEQPPAQQPQPPVSHR